MLRMVFAVLVVVFCSPAFAATAEEEVALDNLALKLSTQAVHEARLSEDEKLLLELVSDEDTRTVEAAGVAGVEVSDEEAQTYRGFLQPPEGNVPDALSITKERVERMK